MNDQQIESSELVLRNRTTEEIRDRLLRGRKKRWLFRRTRPIGIVTIYTNATDIFNPYNPYPDIDTHKFPSIEISRMCFTKLIEEPITFRDTIIVSGSLNTHNGVASGSVTVSNRHLLFNKGWLEGGIGVGNRFELLLAGYGAVSKRIFCNTCTIFQFTPLGIRPGLVSTVAMQLDKHVVGHLTWQAGIQSSISTMIIRRTDRSKASFQIQIGVPYIFVSLNHKYKLQTLKMTLSFGIKTGTFGTIFEYGVKRKLSRRSAFEALVSVGVPNGITLNLNVIHVNQSYRFPIHMSEDIIPNIVLCATVAPVIAWAIIKKFFIDPATRVKKRRAREAHKRKMEERKREAKSAISLMRREFTRIRDRELSKNGLIIIKGLYGRFSLFRTLVENSGNEEYESKEIINVIIPLQCLVKNSKLVLYECSKSTLPGFYDPCVGEEKLLLIMYQFQNQTHQVIIKDNEILRIPKSNYNVK